MLLRKSMYLGLFTSALSLVACGGDEKEAQFSQPPPSQCPPGQYFNGQYCQAQGTQQPPPGQQTPQTGQPAPTTTAQPTAQPPVATSAPGPKATPLDPTAAQGATQVLGTLAQQYVPAGAKPVGSPLAGQFAQGQTLETVVQMQPGKCYTAVAAGLPPIQDLEVQFVAQLPIPGLPSPVLAQDQTQGTTAVIGEKPNCYKWAWPAGGPVKVVLTAKAGQGMAAAQVYEK